MSLNITLQVSSSQAERDQITRLGYQSFSNILSVSFLEYVFCLKRKIINLVLGNKMDHPNNIKKFQQQLYWMINLKD